MKVFGLFSLGEVNLPSILILEGEVIPSLLKRMVARASSAKTVLQALVKGFKLHEAFQYPDSVCVTLLGYREAVTLV